MNKHDGKCVMPDMPYCPCCEYSVIVYPEGATNIYDDDPQWICTLKDNNLTNVK